MAVSDESRERPNGIRPTLKITCSATIDTITGLREFEALDSQEITTPLH